MFTAHVFDENVMLNLRVSSKISYCCYVYTQKQNLAITRSLMSTCLSRPNERGSPKEFTTRVENPLPYECRQTKTRVQIKQYLRQLRLRIGVRVYVFKINPAQ